MGSYTVSDTKSGHKTLTYSNGNEVRLHSAYDPVKEAERAVSGFNKGRASIIVVSGIALGYHLQAIKKKYPETLIVAVEHDREVITICNKLFNNHLKDIPLITSIKDMEQYFEVTTITDFKGLSHFIHRPSYGLYPEFYENIFHDMNRFFTSKISDLLTRFEFEETWITNIFRNIHHIFDSGHVKSLFGKFKGYPGIIVSAGPSLRKNIQMLEKLQNRALIICVDTAIKVLNRIGITPHIVMTLDAQKHSIKHFLGLRGPLPYLLADVVSYPVISRIYEGQKIYSTTSKYYSDRNGATCRETTPLMDWVEQYTPAIGDIQSGGSVATSAFDLLLNLGCSPIILVGQDLAYTGREIHCSGTHHNDDWLTKINRYTNLDTINQKVVRKRKIKKVPSVDGGTVISDFVFDLYKNWFEDSAAKIKIPVINATEGGARIANTTEKSLSELSRKLPEKKAVPLSIIHSSLKKNQANPQKFIQALEQASKDIDEITALCEKSRGDSNIGQTNIILDMISNSGLTRMYSPFLKKTTMYISRHELNPEKTSQMLLNDITAASNKLIQLIDSCLKNISDRL